MRALWERTAANGIEREWLNAEELREREPNITGLGGIFVPSSGIVSYREVTAAMAKIFQDRGGEIIYNAEVSALNEHKNGVVIRTSQGGEYETSTLPDGKLIDDFLFVTTPRTIHTCNAPSPAATSAIPIGAHIVSKVQTLLASQSNPGRTLRAARCVVAFVVWLPYTPLLINNL